MRALRGSRADHQTLATDGTTSNEQRKKATAVEEIGSELEAATAVFAVDYRGISVPQAAELRVEAARGRRLVHVVKNRLAKRATEGAGAAELDEHLVGPTALTFVRGDAVLAAKAIADFIKRERRAHLQGRDHGRGALDPDQFTAIARLPGVDVLRGQLVGLAASPLTGIVRTLNQLIAGLASQLGQVAEQGLVSGEAPAADEEEAPRRGRGPGGRRAGRRPTPGEPEAPATERRAGGRCRASGRARRTGGHRRGATAPSRTLKAMNRPRRRPTTPPPGTRRRTTRWLTP